jgi:hypothetical protein
VILGANLNAFDYSMFNHGLVGRQVAALTRPYSDLGKGQGERDTQAKPRRCRQEMRDVPGNHCRRGPKSREARNLVVSLIAMTRWGRLRSVQRVSCGKRSDPFVEKPAVFVISGEVLLMEGPLVRRRFPCGASGDTDGQAVGWHGAPRGDYCPGGNDSPFFHHGAVKHEGTYSDERVIMYRAAMEHRSVTHNHPISYNKRKAPAGDVKHAMVLYIGLSAYLNGVNVPSHHRIKPEVTAFSYLDISEHDDPGSEKHILADPGPDSVVFVDHDA